MNFMQEYRKFSAGTECDPRYHIWSAISICAAKLSRNLYFEFGHDLIYPNMYILLVGVPASRKSTSLKMATGLLRTSGFTKFGVEKSSREKFLLDLELGFDFVHAENDSKGGFLDTLLDTAPAPIDMMALLNEPMQERNKISEVYLALGEFCDFLGQNNSGFATTLTNLYDNLTNYPERLKNSKSVNIQRPTINLLGCLTPSHFVTHVPPELIGQGFMSRVLLIYGQQSATKITFPGKKNLEIEKTLALHLEAMSNLRGTVTMTAGARQALDAIYQQFHNIPDIRFQYYCSRRLVHLIKTAIICAAMRLRTEIDIEAVVEANTYLVGIEVNMSAALGEYGESRLSGASQKVIEFLQQNNGSAKSTDIFQAIRQDIEGQKQFGEILQNLSAAHRIQVGNGAIMLCKEEASRNVIHVNMEKYFPEAITKLGDLL